MTTVLLGELGHHARGRTLVAAVDAASGDPPPHGVALAFGKDAQQHTDQLARWVDWAREPGCVLVLMPPFQRGSCDVPTPWEARRADPLAGGEGQLGRTLARERQYELRGDLVPIERVAGQVVTGAWRRHPTAGLVVITTLPLWSLLVLDHRAALRAWLEDLLVQAGVPRAVTEAPVPEAFQPSLDDWTLLLHLCTGPYVDGRAALAALANSDVFRVDGPTAAAALARVQSAGWAKGGALTNEGRQALVASPYALHARDLSRMSHG
ncbi:MAG: hypothetical protein JNL82_36025 [Myxococcales bacterium]|nr:hypothetical protein [Myxococcales bacterium]